MSDFTSRALGPVTLVGGLGGGSFEGMVHYQQRTIPVTLEIDYPGRINAELIDTIDAVLDNLDRVLPMTDDVLRRGLRNDTSSVRHLFELWSTTAQDGTDRSEEEFLSRLAALRLRFSPDRDTGETDRLGVTFGLPSQPELGEVAVRFVDRFGPELVP